MHKTENIKLK